MNIYVFIIISFVHMSSGFNLSNFSPELRIVGGFSARPGQFPYQVSLRSSVYTTTNGHFCGGSILNDRHILTAAHCLYKQSSDKMYVVAGAMRLTDSGQVRRVQSYSYHTLYRDVGLNYDVGIVRLFTPLDIDNVTVTAVRISDVPVSTGDLCIVSGWGQTKENVSKVSNQLMGVVVPVVDSHECARNYSLLDGARIESGMICAGYSEGQKDSCAGDSGGPLVCGGRLAGIVSWGRGCGKRFLPGVYADAVVFRTWIAVNSGTIVTVEYRGLLASLILSIVFCYLLKCAFHKRSADQTFSNISPDEGNRPTWNSTNVSDGTRTYTNASRHQCGTGPTLLPSSGMRSTPKHINLERHQPGTQPMSLIRHTPNLRCQLPLDGFATTT